MNSFNAGRYTHISDVQHEIAKSLIDGLGFGEGTNVLDVGCGDAKSTLYLSEKTKGQVTGLDSSEDMVLIAKDRVAKQEGHDLSIVQADAQNFSLGVFDGVVSFFCLHMIECVDAAFKSISQALSPGGKGFVLVPTDDNHFWEASKPLFAKEPWKSCIPNSAVGRKNRGLEYYKDAIGKTGLLVSRIERQDYVFHFSSKDEFQEWLGVMLGQMGVLPGIDSDTFLEMAIERYHDYLSTNLKIKERNVFVFQTINVEFSKQIRKS
jgi:ubiquinone/menaquinone biosynthesis C-methylase UbiE